MKPLSELRPSTRKTYHFIVNYMRENGYAPSTRDIRDGVPLSSTSVASYHRDQLAANNLLSYDPDRARSITLVGELTLTFYGSDAAFILRCFGENPELAVIDALKQEVGVMEYGT